MHNWKQWPLPSRILFGALLLYSLMLLGVSVTALAQTLWNHWTLKAADIALQCLMAAFFALLLIGLKLPRLTSGLLIGSAVALLMLVGFGSGSASDGEQAGRIGSLVFLGLPMLGAAILLRRQSRQVD